MKVPLDSAALEELRERVYELCRHDGGPVPHADIVAFANTLGTQSQATLDLGASEQVGFPILVVGAVEPPSNRLESLSPREKEVATLIAAGMTNKAIAVRLGLSPATVKDHVHHILQKADLPNRAAIVAHLSRPSAVR